MFFRIFGIIFTVPVFAILYQLLKEAIDQMEDEEKSAQGADPPEPIPPVEVINSLPEPEPVAASVPAVPVSAPAPQAKNPSRKKGKKRRH